MTTPSLISSSPRWINTREYVPPLRSRRDAAGLLALTAVAYVALVVCAAVPTAVGTGISAVVIVAVEAALLRRAEIVAWAMRRVQLGALGRGLIAGGLLVLFAAHVSGAVAVGTAVCVGVVGAAGGIAVGVAEVATFLRTPPVLARGLDVDTGPVPSVPDWLLRRPAEATMAPLVLVALGLAITAGHGDTVAVVGLVVGGVTALLAPITLGTYLLRLRRGRVRARKVEATQRAVLELRPQVLLYYANDAAWRYQVEMWLPTLERMNQQVVVMVRDPEAFRLLAPTELPVLCVQRFTTLAQLPLPDVRAALYVGNAANNIHAMRRSDVTSVFIGHGDSDKAASFNPITRIYDEIWVAGAAGRDRYRTAGLDIPDTAFVVVGRPQLGDIPRRPDADPRLTVLYAPTWEGWGEAEFHSSLAQVGPRLIEALLARPDVRVMYRPHPRTGHRDPAMHRAHLAIVAMLRAAGAREHTIEPPGASAADRQAARERWTDEYWQMHPGHRILTSPAPDLLACFAVTDVLIGDISSVITEFLAADRPFAVINPGAVSDEQFRAQSPSVAGGFLLDPQLTGLDAVLGAARTGVDPTAEARRRATGYLLGPRTPDPAATFRAELDRLCR